MIYISTLILLLIFLNLYLFTNRKYKYIEFNKNERRWVTEHEYDELLKTSGCMVPSFVDVTDLYYKTTNFLDDVTKRSFQYRTERTIPKELKQQMLVKHLTSFLNQDSLKYIIEILSSLHTRYYTSVTGGETSEIIYNYLKSIIDNSKLKCTVEYFKHAHTSPIQHSVIAKIMGSEQESESIIYCAHIDSINSKVSEDERVTARSPGADDNASGVSSVLEAFRIINMTSSQPLKTLEFHFYAGEEKSLIGSSEIAESYKLRDIKIGGVLNNDMIGYTEDGVSAYIVNGHDDYADAELVDLCYKLASTYTNLKLQDGRCGYACSDNFSWARYGYKAVCVSEATPKVGKLNPHNHSEWDVVSNIDMNYVLQHAKLGLAFLIEMGYGEPSR